MSENKKRYFVSIPVTGFVTCIVEADSEKEAIQAGMERDFQTSDIEEWSTHRHVVQGNVCYATLRQAEAEEMVSD